MKIKALVAGVVAAVVVAESAAPTPTPQRAAP
jgi:hypothetical protein